MNIDAGREIRFFMDIADASIADTSRITLEYLGMVTTLREVQVKEEADLVICRYEPENPDQVFDPRQVHAALDIRAGDWDPAELEESCVLFGLTDHFPGIEKALQLTACRIRRASGLPDQVESPPVEEVVPQEGLVVRIFLLAGGLEIAVKRQISCATMNGCGNLNIVYVVSAEEADLIVFDYQHVPREVQLEKTYVYIEPALLLDPVSSLPAGCVVLGRSDSVGVLRTLLPQVAKHGIIPLAPHRVVITAESY